MHGLIRLETILCSHGGGAFDLINAMLSGLTPIQTWAHFPGFEMLSVSVGQRKSLCFSDEGS